jgi:hypothetical protein
MVRPAANPPSAQLIPLIPLRPDLRAATRGRTRTSGRESRGRAGSPRRLRAARAADCAAVSPAGGWGARESSARGEGRRAEFDSRRAYGTHSRLHSRNPSHLRQSFHLPPASRLEGGSMSAGIGARRALGIVAAIWGRRGMVRAAPRLSTKKEGNCHSRQNHLRTRE